MLTLATGNTIQGIAGTASAITYTIFGREVTTAGVETFKVLAQGQLPAAAGVLYTVPALTSAMVSAMFFGNATASPVTEVKIFVDGTADANLIRPAVILPAYGTLTYNTAWQMTDANGILMQGPVSSVHGRTGAVVGLGGMISSTKTDNYAVQTTDAGSILMMNAATLKTFTLPVVTAADIGMWFTFAKNGANVGNLAVAAQAGNYIGLGASGGTATNSDATQTYANITLTLISATVWIITGGWGTWVIA
jgi:hypothetical protein